MIRPEEAQRPWTVTELAHRIRHELRSLSTVFIKGEVSGMKQSARGHYGFTIRDAQSVVEAMIWADTARRLPMLPEDGQEFTFRGRVDFWPQGGRLRLLVDYLEFDDVGKLRARLEALKQRLEAEGAFEESRRRPIPYLPSCVGLITSPTGAVIHDLQQTIWDRFPNMEIVLYPAQVQGTASPGSVAAALRRCNEEGAASVVVIARGGGSFEELYAFNTEPVARAILASAVPVVTALGHTSDRTIADMVADAECRTPTEAGARVVPRKSLLLEQLAERRRRVEREAGRRLSTRLEALGGREHRLRQVLSNLFRQRSERLARCRAELGRLSPLQQVTRREQLLAERRRRLESAAARAIRDRRLDLERRRVQETLTRLVMLRFGAAERNLEHRSQRLAALSPEAVLSRGYSITREARTGRVIRSAASVAAGTRVRVRLASGSLGASVEEVQP